VGSFKVTAVSSLHPLIVSIHSSFFFAAEPVRPRKGNAFCRNHHHHVDIVTIPGIWFAIAEKARYSEQLFQEN
jgi:hypothetical protein